MELESYKNNVSRMFSFDITDSDGIWRKHQIYKGAYDKTKNSLDRVNNTIQLVETHRVKLYNVLSMFIEQGALREEIDYTRECVDALSSYCEKAKMFAESLENKLVEDGHKWRHYKVLVSTLEPMKDEIREQKYSLW